MAKISKSGSPEAAFAFFESFLVPMGYSVLTASYMKDEFRFGAAGRDFRYNNLPDDWHKQFTDKEFSQTDPIREMAKRTKEPFYLSECYAKTGASIEVLEMFKCAFGVVEAIIYPMHTHRGGVGGVFIGAEKSFKLSPKHEAEFRTLSNCIFNALSAFHVDNSSPRDIQLLDRQLEILKFSSKGYAPDVIGKMLGKSAIAMKRDIQDICFKLDVHDIDTAVLQASRKGLIPQQSRMVG